MILDSLFTHYPQPQRDAIFAMMRTHSRVVVTATTDAEVSAFFEQVGEPLPPRDELAYKWVKACVTITAVGSLERREVIEYIVVDAVGNVIKKGT